MMGTDLTPLATSVDLPVRTVAVTCQDDNTRDVAINQCRLGKQGANIVDVVQSSHAADTRRINSNKKPPLVRVIPARGGFGSSKPATFVTFYGAGAAASTLIGATAGASAGGPTSAGA